MELVPTNIAWDIHWAKKVCTLALKILQTCVNLYSTGFQHIPERAKETLFTDDEAETLFERSDRLWPAMERAASSKRKGIFSSEELLRV